MKFLKMHALGNDFVFISRDQIANSIDIPALAIKVANRHTGIGCDQFIIYHENSPSSYEMSIYNPDGTVAKACGNATRCMTKLAKSPELMIKVLERQLECKVISPEIFEVNMGPVSFTEEWMPSSEDILVALDTYKVEAAICVDMGNPHFVIITKNELSDQEKYLLGTKFERHELFTDGVNVNFMSIDGSDIVLQVWERGAHLTLACGSGACASFAAARKLDLVGDKVKVKFALGSLEMLYKDGNIIMSGPATLVASGEYYDE